MTTNEREPLTNVLKFLWFIGSAAMIRSYLDLGFWSWAVCFSSRLAQLARYVCMSANASTLPYGESTTIPCLSVTP